MRGRLAGLQGLDWAEALAAKARVRVMNDAHAALLGEAWTGAAAGAREAVLLTLGTGVGGAILTGGRILTGATGKAGHWGHVTVDADGPPSIAGMPGSLEAAIGNYTVADRSGGRFRDTRDLVAAHRAGDAEATAVWLRSVQRLACAVASIVNALDPEVVILGGGIARAGPALFEPLAGFLDSVEWRPLGRGVRVVPAALGDLAGAIGAARAVLTPEPRGT
jgi:glucokinase